ncbi:MAG TPA: hypothetical protein VJT78_04950 [Candidatus Dormibacteraeota bacterium]|nr:hypothetical protein [Candidatus Dormibacteraeota bacterium]
MASKSRAKAGVRAGKGKAGRRPPVRVKRASDLPIMPIAVGVVLVALAVVMIVFIVQSLKPTQGPPVAGGVPCDHLEQTQIHYHAALQIVYQGNVVNLPDNLGINYTDSSQTSVNCYYWLHVHAANKNVIHIESPASSTFTLSQFIAVWKSWAQQNGQAVPKLDATHVGTFVLTPDQKLVVYIDLQDGKGPQVFTGDPNTIQLKAHEVITLEITPPQVTPPPSWDWNSTSNQGL